MFNESLPHSAPNQKREDLKNRAVEIRESGDLETARRMFLDVIEWDKANGNPVGQMDALGHLRITYTRLADESSDESQRREYMKKALEAVEEAIEIGDNHPEIPEGPRVIQRVHYASALLGNALETEGPKKAAQLEKALGVVNEAIQKLPGSQAHKAWPANVKARILHELGRSDEAMQILAEAETWLYKGYDDEVKEGDQAEIKLNVWKSGLDLTRAQICADEGKEILARYYASLVIQIADSQLGERKKEAQRILDSIRD